MNATTHQRQRAVRIEIGAEARSYVSEGQRVTLVPLTIKRRQNRKLLIPPAPEIADRIGGFDVPMIKTLGKAFCSSTPAATCVPSSADGSSCLNLAVAVTMPTTVPSGRFWPEATVTRSRE